MAGAGYKLFNTGDVLTAAQVNTYLMEQTVMVFADAAARTTALTGVVSEGMISYLKDTNAVEVYNGSAWVASDDPNAIQNTIVDAKGDLISATAADTPARLASSGVNGDVLTVDTSTATGLKWAAPAGGSGDTFAAGKNKIINGNFGVWQRGTSVTGGGGGAYTSDRWMLYAGGQGTVSRQVTNDTTNLPFIQYCARVQRNNGSSDTTVIPFGQSLESSASIPFAGKTVVLSFYARKGANYSSASDALSVTLATGTGTDQNYLSAGYTGAATPISQTATLTSTWQRFSYSATLSTSMTEMAVRFQFTPVGTAGAADYFEITGVQVEAGSTATDFQTATGTLQGELAACQRYYFRINGDSNYNPVGTGYANATTTGNGFIPLPTMRIKPSSVEYTNLVMVDGVNVYTSTGLTLGAASTNIARVDLTGLTGLTQYRPYSFTLNNSASQYVAFNAEL